MKTLSYFLIAISVVLIVFNLTQVNYNNPLDENSSIALIGVVSGFCAIILLLILRISKKIEEKSKG